MKHTKKPFHLGGWVGRLVITGLAVLAVLLGHSQAGLFGQSAEETVTSEGNPLPSVGPEAGKPLSASERALFSAQGRLRRAPQLIALGPDSPNVNKAFEGFGFNDNATENGGFLFIPPDPIGAAGHSRVIAVVNSMIEARTKGGDLKWRDSLFDFYAPLGPAAFPFDPKIIYDHYEDRFVVVALELIVGTASISPTNVSRILLAVSKDGNPKTPTAADWHYHAINSKTLIPRPVTLFEHWADYPGFEVGEEAVYVTANMFTFVPFGSFGGVRLWIVDKGADSGGFYDGGAAGVTVHNPYAGGGIATTTMPAQVFGAGGAGGPGSTLGTFLVSYSGLTFGGPGGSEVVQVVTVSDPLGNVGGPFFTQEFVIVGDLENLGGVFGFPALPDAPQAGTAVRIEVNDRRALDAVWRNDSLWFTTEILPNSGPDVSQTTAHWFQLNTSLGPGALTLADQGNVGGDDIAPGTFTYFPAVAVNRRDEVAFGFSASAPTIFAGAFVTGRQPDDPLGTVQASETVKAGEDFYIRTFGGPRNRWGDYSGIALDPSNEKFFWVFNEFADQRGTPTGGGQDGRWGTAWGRSRF